MDTPDYQGYNSGWGTGYETNPLFVSTMTPVSQNMQNQEGMQGCGKISARNQLSGVVTKITPGAVNSVVEVDIGCGHTITSVITMASVKDLGLQVGSMVTAIIKSSDVILMA